MGMLEKFTIKDKVIVLIGGKGIYGEELTRGLGELGAIVYDATRNQEELKTLLEPMQKEGLKVIPAYADFSKEETLIALRDRVLAEQGHIDGLVVNAVTRGLCKGGWQCTIDDFGESLKVNAGGMLVSLRTFGDVMEKQKWGSCVLIGSMMGMVGVDRWNYVYEGSTTDGYNGVDYYFHKAGDINLARFAASYYGPSGVRVNCVSPGGCASPRNTEEFREIYSKRTFLHRMANPDDLPGTVAFLLSDASSYVTGVNIPVDGGYTAK